MVCGHRRTEHEFRMPLHADHVARAAPAYGFDDFVGNCERFDVKPAAGRILLQSEGFEIYFRKVELKPLKK